MTASSPVGLHHVVFAVAAERRAAVVVAMFSELSITASAPTWCVSKLAEAATILCGRLRGPRRVGPTSLPIEFDR